MFLRPRRVSRNAARFAFFLFGDIRAGNGRQRVCIELKRDETVLVFARWGVY